MISNSSRLSLLLFLCGSFACIYAQVHISSSSGGGATVDVEQHTPIRLVCRVPVATTTITWFRGDEQIVDGSDVKITAEGQQVASDTRRGELELEEAEEEHAGVYKCKGDDVESSDSVTVTVSKAKHQVKVTQSAVAVALGADLTLTCEADVHTDVAWFHGGSTAAIKDGVTETANEEAHVKTLTLVRRKVTSADAGTYVCRNRHHADESAQSTVTIGGAGGNGSIRKAASALVISATAAAAAVAMLMHY